LQDIDALYESGLNELLENGRCIRRSNMYFTLGDNRKYFSAEDLYGVPTTLLKGALCYYFVDETFYETVTGVLRDLGVQNVKFLPSTLAQSLYLLPQKRREGYAFLLDVGFLSTSVSVVYGNGIVHEESFDCGLGTILVSLMQELQVEYAVAEEILAASNVSGGSVPREYVWTSENGEISFPVRQINEIIKCGLDVLCENVENFFGKYYREKATVLAVNPISVTGEGICGIVGGAEHVSKRLNRLTEIVYPDLPYYDKPNFSSRMALLDMALNDRKKRGWIYRIFNNFGGKKK
jgi:cell division ATPase FtsA